MQITDQTELLKRYEKKIERWLLLWFLTINVQNVPRSAAGTIERASGRPAQLW